MSKRRCPICRSKKWRKEPHSGIITCSEGHVLQDYRNETNETTEFGPHALHKRTLKSIRSVKERSSKVNPILYHGERARFLYFQCLQVILRMQIKKLSELWKLPPEFEIICRDIWALHLSLLSSPPSAEPLLFDSEFDISHNQNDNEGGEKRRNQDVAEELASRGEDDNEGSSEIDNSSSESGDGNEEDPEIAELLRQASESGESSDDDIQTGIQRPLGINVVRKRNKRWKREESPAATLCVLIHACWLMRIPVIYKDITHLVETYNLPYLDPIRLLPPTLTRHLNKYTQQALSPHNAPTPMFLHTIASRLSKVCYEKYGVYTPELNAAPILWRATYFMGGSPTLYRMSKTLARYLEFPLLLNQKTAPQLLRVNKKDPISHKSDNVPPEVAFVAVIIIVLKMIYGFDDGERNVYPNKMWDPAWAMPDLGAYVRHLRSLSASELSFVPSSMNTVEDADDEELDQYLSFCERNLADRGWNGSTEGQNELVKEYFGMGKKAQVEELLNADEENDDRVSNERRDVLPCIGASNVREAGVERERRRKPGEGYVIYSAQDIVGELPAGYSAVLDRAEVFTGIGVDELCAVVERYERRLVRRWKRRNLVESVDRDGSGVGH